MILNIAINKNFSNILNMENFEEQIKEHTEELTQDLSIDQVETFLGYYDVPGTDIVLREYQQRAVNNANKKFEERQFASIILPTGAGKSFVAMTELLEHKNDRMLYLAPSNEILDQIRKYIIENIHGTKGTLNKTPDQIIKEVFPNLELATYQSLLHKKGDILKESKYDFMVLDELHRTGAEKWQKKLELLLESQEEQTKILGITATPERDADGRNMADELALKIGKKYNEAYTEEEVKVGKHIAMNMDLIEAIRLGIVVNPKIVSCEYNIIHGGTLEKLLQRINEIEDETKKTELMQKYENLRGKLSNAQGIPELLAQNIQKKNGRYIVFIPVSDDGEDLEDEYGNKSSKKNPEDKIKEAFDYIDTICNKKDKAPYRSFLINNEMSLYFYRGTIDNSTNYEKCYFYQFIFYQDYDYELNLELKNEDNVVFSVNPAEYNYLGRIEKEGFNFTDSLELTLTDYGDEILHENVNL